MSKGICTVSVAPIRAEHSHQSEMTSQLLYGETFNLLEIKDRFAKIRIDFDGDEGWISTNQFTKISEEDFANRMTNVITNTVGFYDLAEGKTLLSLGSELATKNQKELKPVTPENIAETAKLFLNVPYLWSGRSFFGVDCSGFVQLVYKIHGVALPRDSPHQAEIGEVLSFVEESQPGDLAFFENSEGIITHVGLMLNNQEIIHAFGKVRIDSLDSTGIFNKDLNQHTHKLRFLRSLF